MEENVSLYVPKLDDLWFRQEVMADPKSMSYNAGYDVSYAGYHRDTGCIDFPEENWQVWAQNKLNDPNFFYAYIKNAKNEFVGYLNFNKNPSTCDATMGIVIKDEFRGRGYMRPAIKLLIEKAKLCGVKKLCDTVPTSREGALRVFYGLGFQLKELISTKKFGEVEDVASIEFEIK